MNGILGLDAADYDCYDSPARDNAPELPETVFDDALWANLLAQLPVAVSYEEVLRVAAINDEAAAHWLALDYAP